jgi:hypothetical protein
MRHDVRKAPRAPWQDVSKWHLRHGHHTHHYVHNNDHILHGANIAKCFSPHWDVSGMFWLRRDSVIQSTSSPSCDPHISSHRIHIHPHCFFRWGSSTNASGTCLHCLSASFPHGGWPNARDIPIHVFTPRSWRTASATGCVDGLA